MLYRFDSEWGFRAATKGYYGRFPLVFTRNITPEREGIWIAFSDLCVITDVQDFNVGFHELGSLGQIICDKELDVFSFRYLAEPQTHWMPVNDSAVDPYDYGQIISYLQGQYGWPNLLLNDRFEEGPPDKADHWSDFYIGMNYYTYITDPTGGRDGGRALKLVNETATDTLHGGARQVIFFNQTMSRPLYISGWSKAENVTGSPDANYSVYLDVHYTDGSASWGHTLTFDTDTHDWQFREGIIAPTKPISYVSVHCLLRGDHQGTVWFDGPNVHEVIMFLGDEQVPKLPNQLTNAAFENGTSNSADYWDDFYLGSDYYTYTVDSTGGRDGSRAAKLTNEATTDTLQGGTRQVIYLNQTISSPLYFEGWSRAENVTGGPSADYSVYIDVHYTDGSTSWGHALTFDTDTPDWQFRAGYLIPAQPIWYVTVHCLLRGAYTGTVWFDDLHVQAVGGESLRSEATLSSGLFDECGRYRYQPYDANIVPWCAGRVGCAEFIVNPDPDISDPDYSINKGQVEWPLPIYPDLAGEFIDSSLRNATVMDYRRAHFAAADIPLVYGTRSRRVGVPEGFATDEFVRWVAQDVHDSGKWMMANWILRDLWWGADLFDVMGTEINWLSNGELVPESDSTLSYRRTLAYQRPYLLLMNTNFYSLTHDLVERYFQIALFYGFYPSMFSQDAATDPYWEDPSLYNRDRDLFKRYIPLIRRLNVAGWEPVTYATTSHPNQVYIERFGLWPDLHFALRNVSAVTTSVTVTLQACDLNLPAVPLTATALLADEQLPISAPSTCTRTLAVTLASTTSEIIHLGTNFALVVTPTTDAASGAPGTTVPYPLQVTNAGNVTDAYTVTVSGNIWPTQAPQTIAPLAAGDSTNITVSVTIPLDAAGGAIDTAAVVITSQRNHTRSVTSTLTTTANSVYSLTLTPATDTRSGAPGMTVTYTLHLTNAGSITDTFTFTYTGNSWSVYLPMTRTTLTAGQVEIVIVHVTIPSDAVGGTTDTLTLTVTSWQGSAVPILGTSTLTTRANLRLVFLPIIMKQYTMQ